MKTFVAEVPRFFTKVEAETDKEGIALIKEEAGKVVEKYATIEDVTNDVMPSSKEVITSRNNSMYNKIRSLYESGKSITTATGGKAFLGIGGGDVLFSSNLCDDLGIKTSEPYLSLGSFLNDIIKSNSKPPQTNADPAPTE